MVVTQTAIQRFSQPVQRLVRSDFVRHGALVFAATMAVNILNYLFNFALSRRLGVEGFAALSSLTGGLMIASIPAAIWNLLVVKYTAEYSAGSDVARLRRLEQMLLKWGCSICLLIFVIGLSMRAQIADFLRISNDGTIVLYVGLMAAGFLMPSVRGVLQGVQDFKRFSLSTLLEIFFKVALGVSLAYAGFGVQGAISGWLCGTMLALAFTVWAVHGRQKVNVAPVRLRLDFARLIRTTAGIAFATSSLTMLSFTDVVLVKHYFNARDAGLYAAVNLTGKVVLFLVSFLPLIVLPKAASKAKQGESPVGLLVKAGVATIVMSGLALAAFGLEPAAVLRLFAGNDFALASPYVFQYDLAMAMLACVTLLVNYSIALHRFRFLLPLGAIVVAEIWAIAAFHSSLWSVIHVLLAGNATAMVVCCYRITGRSGDIAKSGLEADSYS